MLPTTLIEPDGAADIAPSSGTLGLGAGSGLKRDQTPLQSQSSYVARGGSIYIGFITTFTFEQPSLPVEEHPVSLRCVTTFRTLLRSLCSRNFNDINPILPCNGLNCCFEFSKWNAMNLPVDSLRLSSLSIMFPQVFEFLNSNYSIVFHCNLNNLVCNLPYPRVDEVPFVMPHPAESTPCSTASLVRITPELTSSLHELPLPVPYILPKIELFQNFPITSQNRNSKTTAVNINPYNSFIALLNLELLSKVSDDNVMAILFVQSELGANPTIVDVFNKSFISTILLDWQGNSTIAIRRNNNDRISSLSLAELARTGDVKPDRNLPKSIWIRLQVLPDLMDAVNEDLGMQIVFLSDSGIGGGM